MFRPSLLGLLTLTALAVSPAGALADPVAYSAYEGTDLIYSIDLATGIATPVSTAPLPFTAVGLTSVGSNLAVVGRPTASTTQLYNLATPGGTPVPVGTGLGVGRANAAGLAYDPSTGTLYALIPNVAGEAVLFSIDPTTGQATPVSSGAGNPYADGLAFDSAGRGVAADALDPFGTGVFNLYDVDPRTGLLSNPFPLDLDPNGDGLMGFASLVFDGDDLYLLSSFGVIFRVDRSLPGGVSGPIFIRDSEGNRLDQGEWRGLAIPGQVPPAVEAVPEPSSLAVCVLLSAVGGVAAGRVRRRAAAGQLS